MLKTQLEYDAKMEEEESIWHAHLRSAEEDLLWWNRTVMKDYDLRMRIQEVFLREIHIPRCERRCDRCEVAMSVARGGG
jgi:hypothetical protein